MNQFIKDNLNVKIFETREEMGQYASNEISSAIKEFLKTEPTINMIFAAAPSQNDVLKALTEDKTIPFERINAFHMDEYIGLSKDAPQGFGNFLKNALFGKANFLSVNYIDSEATDIQKECERYDALLKEHPIHIVVLGIGENGHIAFNDPHVAEFNDKESIKAVTLDEVCRQQQVNDGCFANLDAVPKQALTLTIPTLFSGQKLFCIVPAKTKAWAVNETVNGAISEKCPASILRKHNACTLYLDSESASML